jgi:hypothetical protein
MDEAQPQTSKPISDDQELAKVLAGVSQQANDLNFEETPVISPAKPGIPATPPKPKEDDKPTAGVGTMTPPSASEPEKTELETPSIPTTPTASGDLEDIKKDALTELRPLVDKLELEPREKFDIYLLLLRSTDDKTLIAPAHEAAKSIPDESARAQALLDVIKEIDYLSSPPEQHDELAV